MGGIAIEREEQIVGLTCCYQSLLERKKIEVTIAKRAWDVQCDRLGLLHLKGDRIFVICVVNFAALRNLDG